VTGRTFSRNAVFRVGVSQNVGFAGDMAARAQIEEFGNRFGELFYTGKIDGRAVKTLASLTVDEAYSAQDVAVDYRLGRGETVVGYKVGCTSQSIRQQLGLTEPYYARMTAPHVRAEDAAPIDWRNFVSLALEPELVIRMGRDADADRLADRDLIACIEALSVGIELHHFKFWLGKPTAQELIVSNGLFAGLVMGPTWVSPSALDFQTEVFRLSKNGAEAGRGAAREIMGGPLASLRWLVTKLAQRGETLKAGQLVIPGSPVALVPIAADADVTVEIAKVGTVSAHFRAATA
jgi:2-keto-4-pentenoate hydratase